MANLMELAHLEEVQFVLSYFPVCKLIRYMTQNFFNAMTEHNDNIKQMLTRLN